MQDSCSIVYFGPCIHCGLHVPSRRQVTISVSIFTMKLKLKLKFEQLEISFMKLLKIVRARFS